MEREVGGGIGMGNTCKPMAVLFQCMTKFTTNKKKKKKKTSLKTPGDFGLYEHELPVLLAWPWQQTFLFFHLPCFGLFDLTVFWTHELRFDRRDWQIGLSF